MPSVITQYTSVSGTKSNKIASATKVIGAKNFGGLLPNQLVQFRTKAFWRMMNPNSTATPNSAGSRHRRLAASASRNADRKKSIVAPAQSMARFKVAPASLHPDVGLVDPPRLVCWLEMPSQSLLQLRAVILHPTPNRGLVDVETTLLQQRLNIAQRERMAKNHRTAQRMMPGSVCRHLKIAGRVIISRLFHVTSQQPRQVATHPLNLTLAERLY